MSEIKSNKKEIENAMDEAILRALEICGGMCESYAKENLTNNGSVDTGLLRNSITHAIGGEGAAISTYKADKAKKGGGILSGSYSGNAPLLDEPSVIVGTNVEYAMYVEKGTGRKYNGGSGGRQTSWTYQDSKGDWHGSTGGAGKPFLRPALDNHKDEYREVMKNELKNG